MRSEYPFIKLITPASIVGFRDDVAKKDFLHKVFTDAYKSPLSLLILGMIYRPLGSRVLVFGLRD
jgi:vesicle-fusing ATPase